MLYQFFFFVYAKQYVNLSYISYTQSTSSCFVFKVTEGLLNPHPPDYRATLTSINRSLWVPRYYFRYRRRVIPAAIF